MIIAKPPFATKTLLPIGQRFADPSVPMISNANGTFNLSSPTLVGAGPYTRSSQSRAGQNLFYIESVDRIVFASPEIIKLFSIDRVAGTLTLVDTLDIIEPLVDPTYGGATFGAFTKCRENQLLLVSAYDKSVSHAGTLSSRVANVYATSFSISASAITQLHTATSSKSYTVTTTGSPQYRPNNGTIHLSSNVGSYGATAAYPEDLHSNNDGVVVVEFQSKVFASSTSGKLKSLFYPIQVTGTGTISMPANIVGYTQAAHWFASSYVHPTLKYDDAGTDRTMVFLIDGILNGAIYAHRMYINASGGLSLIGSVEITRDPELITWMLTTWPGQTSNVDDLEYNRGEYSDREYVERQDGSVGLMRSVDFIDISSDGLTFTAHLNDIVYEGGIDNTRLLYSIGSNRYLNVYTATASHTWTNTVGSNISMVGTVVVDAGYSNGVPYVDASTEAMFLTSQNITSDETTSYSASLDNYHAIDNHVNACLQLGTDSTEFLSFKQGLYRIFSIDDILNPS